MNTTKFLAVSFLAALLAGCAGQEIPDPDPEYDPAGGNGGADTGGFDDGGFGAGQDVPSDLRDDLANVVYFDFDSYELRPGDAETAAQHGLQLASDSRLSVRLEGHADERGSREYNIGLGERRAQAVRRVLLLQGAQPAQISTVSFGEERPVAFGSDEASWSQNRRVEFIYE